MALEKYPSVWWFAFGYFAAYVPYSALTKAVSKGLLPGMTEGVSGFELLPPTVLVSFLGMIVFLLATGWWKYATKYEIGGVTVPGPRPLTLASGLCVAVIIATTTLAYTFTGVSIVFMMLLMRGGVLILAPIVDALSKRRVRWFSWVALGLSLSALVVAFAEKGGWGLKTIAVVDISAYLGAYFFRLKIMSGTAKSEKASENIAFFAEEQLVGTPAILAALALGAMFAPGEIGESLNAGFTTFWTEQPVVFQAVLIGLFSQGTGIFGGLILLGPQENAFCVPVNRSSSILAGLFASLALTVWLGEPATSGHQLVGAGLVLVAILFLSIPPMLAKKRAAEAAA
ncbi:MAG: hypothetical protein GY898_08365 [Proteobacteria bacterium]|nr:hypothetical protein [Pseudomonadota bacterium]